MNLTDFADMLEFQENYEKKVQEAVEHLRPNVPEGTEWAITLGSGLGGLADKVESSAIIDYGCIPNFPTPTVAGHEGKMIVGKLEGVPIVGLKGRKHFYEVADLPGNLGMLKVIFPVHVLAGLGIKNYFVTNAAGGLNPKYDVGDVMIIDSHVNMLPNAMIGRKHTFERLDGEEVFRFQPMNDEYDRDYIDILSDSANNFDYNNHKGVYLSVTGPAYETKAECVAFRDNFGADAVGMSTTPEVITARSRGMNCVGMSCITNKIAKDGTNAANHEEVKAILDSDQVKNRLYSTVEGFFSKYYRSHMLLINNCELKKD